MAHSNKNNFLAKHLVIPNYELILGEIQSFYLANMPDDKKKDVVANMAKDAMK